MTTVLQLDDIKPRIDPRDLIGEIETGFVLYSTGKVVVPPVGFLNFDDPPGDVHIKYGYVPGDDYYVLKIASGFPGNAAHGVPTADGMIVVCSQKTGHLELILHDRCWLTDMRTAAAGAVAAIHLAPAKVTQIGIVGTGVQARMQLEMLHGVVDCQRCQVWGRNSDKVDDMIAGLRASETIGKWGLELNAASDIGQLAAECNLIVTTTSAREPLLLAGQVRPGTHITAVGSDDHGKQELEAALLAKADRVVADSISQCVDHGECHYAVRDGLIDQGVIVELGHVIEKPALGRSDDEQITIADLTGVAIQDIQIAKVIARQLALGRRRQS